MPFDVCCYFLLSLSNDNSFELEVIKDETIDFTNLGNHDEFFTEVLERCLQIEKE